MHQNKSRAESSLDRPLLLITLTTPATDVRWFAIVRIERRSNPPTQRTQLPFDNSRHSPGSIRPNMFNPLVTIVPVNVTTSDAFRTGRRRWPACLVDEDISDTNAST